MPRLFCALLCSSLSIPHAQGSNVLREPQVNVTDSVTGLVEEQHSVRGSLLDHFCVDVVAVRPCAGILVVGVGNQAREVGLLVARSGIVEAEEGDGHGSNRDVKASLSLQLVHCLFHVLARNRCSLPGPNVRRSSQCRQRCGERHQRCGRRDDAGSGFAHHARSVEQLFEGVAWCIGKPMGVFTARLSAVDRKVRSNAVAATAEPAPRLTHPTSLQRQSPATTCIDVHMKDTN